MTMKKMKKVFAILLAVCMMLTAVPVSAASKNVTATYKKPIGRFLKEFDGFLGFAAYNTSRKFKFDDYTKTSMLIYAHRWVRTGSSMSTIKKTLKPKMKKYFTSGSIKVKKYAGRSYSNPAYVFQMQSNKLIYTSGDWGGEYPKGKISKIVKSGSNYIVNYKVYICDEFSESRGPLMGTYKITLKKSGGSFKIKDIKQTHLYKWH